MLRRRKLNPEAPNTSLTLPEMPAVGSHDVDEEARESDVDKSSIWTWWRGICSSPYILGPMIGQSERAFRILCRQIGGVGVCYSPMYLAEDVLRGVYDEELMGDSCRDMVKQDRPLIYQLAGNDPNVLVAAGRKIQGYCDAIDINFGCPQKCAEVGNYGSYLLDRDPELAYEIIQSLVKHLDIPIVAKMRLQYGDISATVEVAHRLELAGAIFA